MNINESQFSDLVGKTLIECDVDRAMDTILFKCSDGSAFRLHHSQECCESVTINDICGDVDNLVGHPILVAEEVSNEDYGPSEGAESYTWTFYKLATIKGWVTIRWFGESNGYYSESVDFIQVSGPTQEK